MVLKDSVCGFCGRQGKLNSLYATSDIFGNQYVIGYCPDCYAYSLHPRPDRARLEQAYDSSYYGEKEQKFSFPLVEKVLDWFREGRGRRLCRYLHDGDRVLDLGCGNGRFLQSLLKRRNLTAWGIEPPGKSAERAATIKGINLKTGYLEAGDFEASSFQAITLFHVFEHLTNPQEILDIIDKILCSGGILMVSFPNIDSWQSKWFKGNWLHLDPPRHLFFLAPATFEHIMQKRGYRLLKRHFGSIEQNPFGMVQSILNTMTVKREILFEHMKGNTTYTSGYAYGKLLLQKVFFALSFPVFILTNFLSALFKKGATVEFTFQKLN